jgi:hypothetical protein
MIGSLHHVELRVATLASAVPAWQWLLGTLGYTQFQSWPEGISWKLGHTYLVLEQAPSELLHNRRGAGLSHLAFHAGSRAEVDALWAAAPAHGWAQLYTQQHPWAGGEPASDGTEPGHYAAYLETGDRFKVELVASDIHLM